MASLRASVHDDTDFNTALVEQFLNIPVTQWEAVLQPKGVLNDGHRETVAVGFRVGYGGSAYPNPIKATQPTLEEQVLSVLAAQGVPVIQPDRMADDPQRKSVAGQLLISQHWLTLP